MKAVARCRWSVPEIRHVIYLSPSVAGFLQAGGVHLLRKLCVPTTVMKELKIFFAQSACFRQSARLLYIFVSESCLVYVVLHMIPGDD